MVDEREVGRSGSTMVIVTGLLRSGLDHLFNFPLTKLGDTKPHQTISSCLFSVCLVKKVDVF